MVKTLRTSVAALLASSSLVFAPAVPRAVGAPAPSKPAPTSAAAATSAASAQGVSFGIQSATHGKPDTRSSLTYSATPGARVSDEVAVVNIGTQPVTVAVYATDATSSPDGAFTLLAGAQRPTQVGTWLNLGAVRTVTLPGRTKRGASYKIVPFTLHVPANATPGDHAGGIVVSLAARSTGKSGTPITLDQRVALRVYTRISGVLHAQLKVENLHVHYAAPALLANPFGTGTATVTYDVRNTGNVVLGADQKIDVAPWIGSGSSAKNVAPVPALLPGGLITVTRKIGGVFPGGPVTANVHLHPVAPPGGADPRLADITASVSAWGTPWVLLVVVLLLFAGLGYLIWQRLRPRPASAATSHRRSRGSK